MGFWMDGCCVWGEVSLGGNCLRAAFVVGLMGFVRGGCRGIEADVPPFFFPWVYVGIGGQGE